MTKRFFDLSVIVFFSPAILLILLLMSFLVFIFIGRPIFFCQARTGRFGKTFKIIKFRSMSVQVSREGHPLSDASRLTWFGRLIRGSSLDEIPEFMNVLKGEMSLVGPRPLLPEYLSLYSSEQSRRHDVRPGITGWAQINGRNALSWEEKFELDVWYVDNQSLWLDIKILFKTVLQVLKRDGISHGGDATMPRFKGSNHDD